MKVELINFTDQAKELLVLGKRTRHMKDSAAWAEVLGMAEESLDEELGYVFSTISGPLEFVNYTFLITGVTRAFTHQLVRHRVGVSFAQQSQRFAEQEGFNYLTTGSINRDDRLGEIYDNTMDGIQSGYSELLAEGANQQDARGVLPTNILTNILMKMNLRSLSSLMEVRLCVRSQGEFQDVSRRGEGSYRELGRETLQINEQE